MWTSEDRLYVKSGCLILAIYSALQIMILLCRWLEIGGVLQLCFAKILCRRICVTLRDDHEDEDWLWEISIEMTAGG